MDLRGQTQLTADSYSDQSPPSYWKLLENSGKIRKVLKERKRVKIMSSLRNTNSWAEGVIEHRDDPSNNVKSPNSQKAALKRKAIQ